MVHGCSWGIFFFEIPYVGACFGVSARLLLGGRTSKEVKLGSLRSFVLSSGWGT